METCRVVCPAGKPLLVHADTVTCVLSGCIACAYKLVVKPVGGDFREFALNVRPEECLRLQKAAALEKEEDKAEEKDSDMEVKQEEAPAAAPYQGLYNSDEKLLVVGDGNLSFSLSLAKHLGGANIVATTYLTLSELQVAYGEEIDEIIAQLTKTGAKVLHGVDATALESSAELISALPDHLDAVIFNFPCISGSSDTQDG